MNGRSVRCRTDKLNGCITWIWERVDTSNTVDVDFGRRNSSLREAVTFCSKSLPPSRITSTRLNSPAHVIICAPVSFRPSPVLRTHACHPPHGGHQFYGGRGTTGAVSMLSHLMRVIQEEMLWVAMRSPMGGSRDNSHPSEVNVVEATFHRTIFRLHLPFMNFVVSTAISSL